MIEAPQRLCEPDLLSLIFPIDTTVVKPGSNILELAPALGRNSIFCAHMEYSVTAIENNLRFYEPLQQHILASEKLQQYLTLIQADPAEYVATNQEHYDVVICHRMLQLYPAVRFYPILWAICERVSLEGYLFIQAFTNKGSLNTSHNTAHFVNDEELRVHLKSDQGWREVSYNITQVELRKSRQGGASTYNEMVSAIFQRPK